MECRKQLKLPVRWYAPDEKAEKRLLALGVRSSMIYRGWKGEVPGKFRMRAGEFLGVVDGLHAFGVGLRAIKRSVALIHADGAAVLDVETGQDSRTHGIAMYDGVISRRRLTQDEKLLRAEKRREKDGMASTREAHTIWFGPGTIPQKVTATRWSRSLLHKTFGKSGAPPGRPPKAVSV